MKKVENRKVIRTLSYRTMREKKWKNLIAILAIALTALMLTALFTVGSSMISSMEESTMRQVGISAHGGYKYLSMEEYERIRAAGGYKDISFDIIAGFAVNPELAAIQTEVRYGEDKMARWSFAYPEKGKMPEAVNECVASSKVLEALGIPMELGAKVPLRISTSDGEGNERVIEEEFVLSGYYQSNDASHAQELWISRQWLDENVDLLTQNYEKRMKESGIYGAEGTVQAAVWFDSSFDIESQVAELTGRAGFSENEVHESVNWAYATSSVDTLSVVLAASILGIIILSGYLIIYNIFYINVTIDIRYYGLLKTIGTTGRQLRRLVRMQALLLSAVGIPLGLFAGWFVGGGLLPIIYKIMSINVTNVELNVWIFLGSALFALLVVYLSCIKPCRLASKISPVEAVRYVENSQYKKKKKKSAKVSPARLAAANMGRNRRRAVLVVASLSLSLILLNSTYGLVKGFSFDEYVEDYLVADMQLSHTSSVNMASGFRDCEAVTPQLMETVREMDGVEKIETLWVKYGWLDLSGQILENFVGYFNSEEFLNDYAYLLKNVDILEMKVTGVDAYSMNEDMMPLLDIKKGSFDREKFLQGGYCLLLENGEVENWLNVGDKITIGSYGTEGEPEKPGKELEIMAAAKLPHSAGTRSRPVFAGNVLLSKTDFDELFETRGGLHGCLTIEEGKEEQVEAAINELISNEYPELVLITMGTLEQEFSALNNTFAVVGGLLGAILGLIGTLNFINAMVTGILSRKQEFAMMQAVGMTGEQLKNMLIMEGVWYGVCTLVIAMTLGNVISYGFLYLIGRNMRFFEWGFHILPILVSIPVIAVISVLLPMICYHTLCRRSIIERLRLAEV